MRKLTIVMVICLLAAGAVLPFAEVLANSNPTITVDGVPVVFPDAQPFVDANSRTLAPVRFIAEAIGVRVYWDGALQRAEFTDGFTHVFIDIGSRYMLVTSPLHDEAEIVVMDTEAVIVDSRTFVPVRFLAEAYGAELGWDGETRAITITTRESLVDWEILDPPQADNPSTNPNTNPNPTTSPNVTPPADTDGDPGSSPGRTEHRFDMNDPNVRAFPFLATATNAEELRSDGRPTATRWQSAAEIIAHQQNPDNMIGDQTFYEWRMVPIRQWLDARFAIWGRDMADVLRMTDYEKSYVIRDFIADGYLEEFIGLWQPNFRFIRYANGEESGNGNCATRAQAIQFLMIAMDFEMFAQIAADTGLAHGLNAYWDSSAGIVRLVDGFLPFGIWNLAVDELYPARGWLLTHI